MQDYLVRALAYNDEVRVFALSATDMVNEARRRHDTWHTATAALGRTLIATALLGADLKNESDRVIVEILGDGPLGRLVTEADNSGNVRGFVSQPHVALPLNEAGGLDVAGAVGLPGTLVVRKDYGLKQPFTGQVDLVSGELAEDFTYYMAVSEQTPSSFGLSVLVNPDESVEAAGGFMIQVMPNASEETISSLEERISKISGLSSTLEEMESLEELIEILVGKDNYKIIAEQDIRYFCPRNKDSFTRGLAALGPDTLQELVDEDGGAEVICHFCNSRYQFSEQDLLDIINELTSGDDAN